MYDASTIARYIIRKYGDRGQTISNLKLQKVLYFVQAEFLASTGEPCFKDSIEAWPFGPVVPTVYRKYKVYSSAQIPVRAASGMCFITQTDKKLIDGMIDECAKYSASQLCDITQRQPPWLDVYKDDGVTREISNESIKKFFMEDDKKS